MTTDTASAWTELPQLPLGPEGRVRFSRDAYHRMFDAGLLDNEKRYELIDGVIFMMSPISPGQGGLMGRLNEFFHGSSEDRAARRTCLPARSRLAVSLVRSQPAEVVESYVS
jgi:hypothetical protein